MFEDIELLKSTSDRLIDKVSMDFRRYLCSKIDWRNRFICLKGARGTGKTTLLRQAVKERFGLAESAFYVSFDHFWFATHSPLEFVDQLYKNGITDLFIDEVHHVEHWQTLIKTIYDAYPDLHVAYSGSSILRLDNREGDLSRRQLCYELKGLSFREFLEFEGCGRFAEMTLQEILNHHRELSTDIAHQVKVLPLFRKYLDHGFYPFYKESPSGYFERVTEVVNKVLQTDLPIVEDVLPGTIRKIRKMLAVLAESCPQTPRMADLYRELETDRNQGLKMLDILERAELIQLLKTGKDKLKNLSSPEKIYCDNVNLMRALVSRIDAGTERETYFVNQLRAAGHDVTYPQKGDFKVDGEYVFEIGGAGKGFGQIADMPRSFVAADDLEVGRGNKIPLWLFGFLY